MSKESEFMAFVAKVGPLPTGLLASSSPHPLLSDLTFDEIELGMQVESQGIRGVLEAVLAPDDDEEDLFVAIRWDYGYLDHFHLNRPESPLVYVLLDEPNAFDS